MSQYSTWENEKGILQLTYQPFTTHIITLKEVHMQFRASVS